MSQAIAFAVGLLVGLGVILVVAPLILSSRQDRRPEQTQELALTMRSPKDCQDLAEAINILVRALRWYADGENHPSHRVANLALVEFHAMATRFVDGKGGAR